MLIVSANLSHHEIPGQRDCVSPVFGGVVLSDGVLEKFLQMGFCLCFVHDSKDNRCDLKGQTTFSDSIVKQ
jgi:hypothetical protein